MFWLIFGLVLLIIIAVAVIYVWRIYRSVSEDTQESPDLSTAMSVLPSLDLKLEAIDSASWQEQQKLESTESQLKRIGATLVGRYCFQQGIRSNRVALWNVKDKALAALYELSCADNTSRFVYEVSCKLNEGSAGFSSDSNIAFACRPEQHKMLFKPSESIVDVLKSIKSAIPKDKKLQRMSDPLAFFSQCYEDICDWSWQAEQLGNEKTQQLLSMAAVSISEPLLNDLIEMGLNYSIELNIKRARKALAEHPRISAEKWQSIQDKVVFINDKMRLDDLIDALYKITGEMSQRQLQILDEFAVNDEPLSDPLAIFQQLLHKMQIKAKRIKSMDKPIKTEVYLPS